MSRSIRLISFVFASLFTLGANAAVIINIAPSADGSKTYFYGSWDSLDGAGYSRTSQNLAVSNPVNHVNQGSQVANWLVWFDIGNYKSGVTNEFFLRPNSNSYVSDNPVGLYLDNDNGSVGDDFGLIWDNLGPRPASGSFVIETDTYGPGFLAMWNPGVYTNNPFITLTVTTDAYSASVPAPAALGMMGFSLLALGIARRRAR